MEGVAVFLPLGAVWLGDHWAPWRLVVGSPRVAPVDPQGTLGSHVGLVSPMGIPDPRALHPNKESSPISPSLRSVPSLRSGL